MVLNPPSVLRGYGGSEIETIATFEADIETADGLRTVTREQFHVVNRARQGLLSYEAAKRLNLIRIGKSINSLDMEKPFPKIPNLKVKLKIDETAGLATNNTCELFVHIMHE